MSNRNHNRSVRSANTLLNYFSITPPTKKVKLDENADDGRSSPVSTFNNNARPRAAHGTKKRERMPARKSIDESNDETVIITKQRKRIRVYSSDSNSDTKDKDDVIETSESVQTFFAKLRQDFEYDPNKSTNKQSSLQLDKSTTKESTSASSNSPSTVPSTSCEPRSVELAADDPPVVPSKSREPCEEERADDDGDWVHTKLEWLKPDKIRDKQKRRPEDPDYDPSTLFVPGDFLKKQTPAHRQWWVMKSTHYDSVLFFKVGKFYELYHMDASVGVLELGFNYMKGDFAHSGFPEVAYGRMANTLVSKGYKVARVEQTETPETMQERCRNSGKGKQDKVVNREICALTLRGTQVNDLQDSGPCEPIAIYMMAITEEDHKNRSSYGVCFVDTSIGHFHLGQFDDDNHSSRLLTTLAHYPPAYILYDRRTISPRTSRLLSAHCYSARREPLTMWDAEQTLTTLAEKYYRTSENEDWPQGLKSFIHDGDSLGLTPAAGCSLAVKALGGVVATLTKCLIDIQVLGMSQFAHYAPPDLLNNPLAKDDVVEATWTGGRTMVLDFITLANLKIVKEEGCLYDRLNSCATPMGKRLLYQWVCAPSCNISAIKERQEAVKVLLEDHELSRKGRAILAILPDFERVLAKLHALGNTMRSKKHPDSRAIFYEEKIYTKKNISDFLAVLKGFTDALKLGELFSSTDSVLLKRLTQNPQTGKFPDYRSTLDFFKEGINLKEAKDEGRILPSEGVDEVYDAALCQFKQIETDAKKYLNLQERHLCCRLKYTGVGKRRYQIEIPKKSLEKVGPDFNLEGKAANGAMRYSTEATRGFLARTIAAEEMKANALNDVNRRVFQKFTAHYDEWESAVRCCAALDVLIALAEFARLQTGNICLPVVSYNKNEKPFVNVVEGRHPCISVADNYIPNDTYLGIGPASLLLLTGPNMGGKSTLMRQLALLTVLAHLGSYVPARNCSLSLVDRIFTRLGASDDILTGQSTYLMEMKEAAVILKHATEHSLVLIDELGRGTSTLNGAPIAGGICINLAKRGCRTIFSTHYHSLVRDLAHDPAIFLGHMACIIRESDDNQIVKEIIVFLYKLTPGACPRSYGFNAARLGGIAEDIIDRARVLSENMEIHSKLSVAFKKVLKKQLEADELRKVLSEINI